MEMNIVGTSGQRVQQSLENYKWVIGSLVVCGNHLLPHNSWKRGRAGSHLISECLQQVSVLAALPAIVPVPAQPRLLSRARQVPSKQL